MSSYSLSIVLQHAGQAASSIVTISSLQCFPDIMWPTCFNGSVIAGVGSADCPRRYQTDLVASRLLDSPERSLQLSSAAH